MAAGGGATDGLGTLVFDGDVNGNGNDLDVGTRVSQFTGNTLSLNSGVTRFTGSTNLIADNLALGGGLDSVDGPGALTILRASSATGDTTSIPTRP